MKLKDEPCFCQNPVSFDHHGLDNNNCIGCSTAYSWELYHQSGNKLTGEFQRQESSDLHRQGCVVDRRNYANRDTLKGSCNSISLSQTRSGISRSNPSFLLYKWFSSNNIPSQDLKLLLYQVRYLGS